MAEKEYPWRTDNPVDNRTVLFEHNEGPMSSFHVGHRTQGHMYNARGIVCPVKDVVGWVLLEKVLSVVRPQDKVSERYRM